MIIQLFFVEPTVKGIILGATKGKGKCKRLLIERDIQQSIFIITSNTAHTDFNVFVIQWIIDGINFPFETVYSHRLNAIIENFVQQRITMMGAYNFKSDSGRKVGEI